MLGVLIFSIDLTGLLSYIFQCLVWFIALRKALNKQRKMYPMRSLKTADRMHLHGNSAMSSTSLLVHIVIDLM